jgi:predicted O-linked N-acetylglucosamine transferase (SPINDLY family)
VDPERLIFAGDEADKAAHLARLAHADLFLDTFGRYNAHTTTADALWSGVPLVTTPSESFAGRVAASALRASGLAELVAASVAEYEALAIALALDRDRLRSIRTTLASARSTQPFFDAGRTVHALERAYEAVWQVHARGAVREEIRID